MLGIIDTGHHAVHGQCSQREWPLLVGRGDHRIDGVLVVNGVDHDPEDTVLAAVDHGVHRSTLAS